MPGTVLNTTILPSWISRGSLWCIVQPLELLFDCINPSAPTECRPRPSPAVSSRIAVLSVRHSSRMLDLVPPDVCVERYISFRMPKVTSPIYVCAGASPNKSQRRLGFHIRAQAVLPPTVTPIQTGSNGALPAASPAPQPPAPELAPPPAAYAKVLLLLLSAGIGPPCCVPCNASHDAWLVCLHVRKPVLPGGVSTILLSNAKPFR